jgi:hypothetical protein
MNRTVNFYANHKGGHPFSEAEEMGNSDEIQARCQFWANSWNCLAVAYDPDADGGEFICDAEPEVAAK